MSASNPQPDPLDDLLASARWPDAGEERLERLQTHWAALHDIRPARRVSRVVVRIAAVAAAVLLAVGAAWWAARGDNDVRSVERIPNDIAKRKPQSWPQTPSPVPGVDESVLAAMPNSRPATALETAVFRAWQAERRAASWKQDAAVERSIAAIRDVQPLDDARLAAVARPLLARRAYSERRLLESVLYFDGSRREAALKLLAVVGTTRTVRELLPLVENAREKTAVVATLLRLAPPENLALLARREQNPQARRAMLAALLSAGDERSVGAFLVCASHGATRGAAVELVASTDALPTATLIAWLKSADAQRSAAAAAVLANARDRAAIESLIALARSPNAPPPALVALVGSRQPAAQSFIAAARHSSLVAAVNEAQYQWRVIRNSL